tara:strand:+ start:1168 stop:2286 length:1119 start_codon:yes stop_codon:yes gene_type:complete
MIKKDILLVSTSAMPYTIDRLKSLEGRASCLTIAKCEEPYVEIQNAQSIDHSDLEVIFKDKVFDEIPKFIKAFKLFFSLVKRKEKFIIIGIGGNIRAYHIEVFLAVLLLKLRRKKVFIMFNTNFLDRERTLFIEMLKSFFLAPYDGALCSGPSSAAYIKLLGFKNKRVTDYGFNTIDHKRFKTRNEISSKDDKKYFLYVGRMDSKKNVPFMLKAYQGYANLLKDKALPLKLIGDGPKLDEYVDLSNHLELTYVDFLGTKSDKKIANMLSNARALLIPSIYEEWGIVVNEAISLSVPVLVSEHVRARESIVRQFSNGLILEPDNHIGWVKSMQMITEDESLFNELVNGTKYFKKLSGVESYKKAVDFLIQKTI